MDKKPNILRKTSLALATILLYQAFYATPMMALTSGPSQPEFQSFQPAGVSDMVDLFTGNFNYNIPLLDVGGYPINISYSSDNRMDDEASWVGLGWTLNPGSISRQMRGLPDDHKGDVIAKQFNTREDLSITVSGGPGFELFGLGNLASISGVTYNNRNGFELERNLDLGTEFKIGKSMGLNGNLSLGFSPSQGLSLQGKAGLGANLNKNTNGNLSLSGGYNSRQGLSGVTFQGGLSLNAPRWAGLVNMSGAATMFPGSFSYTPTSALPITNTSGNFRFTGGGAASGANPNAQYNASFSIQSLESNFDFQKGYGYLYLNEGSKNEENLLDYNSEVTGQLNEEIPSLPIAYGTADMFVINGQGISGAFDAKRTDHGLFRPAKERNTSVGGKIGGEVGTPLLFKGGVDLSATIANNTKEGWGDNNNFIKPALKFNKSNGKDEAVYFQSTSDNVVINSNRYKVTDKTTPIRNNLRRSGTSVAVANAYFSKSGNQYSSIGPQNIYADTERNRRNQAISYLTFDEYDLKKDKYSNRFKSYKANKLILSDCIDDEEDDIVAIGDQDHIKDHHIAEFDVTQPDGSRYVFGQPVYNISQKEVSFSVDETNINDTGGASQVIDDVDNPNYGLVKYTSEDRSINNRKGDDHYFDAKTLPAYAHSYLLTELLSPDYVDRTGDGVTDDDLGNGIKFNYTKVNDYKWRIPFRANHAKHHPGLKSTFDDDKASYLYGERELWYQHSIESRTMIALFHTEGRADGLGVTGEDGGLQRLSRQQRLKKIELYSKSEFIEFGEDATPIKTVHFTYNYNLCKGTPNSFAGGKLTLEKIHFTYGKNQRGKLNAYKFDYKNDQDYHLNHYDRWGFFKKNPSNYQPHHDYPFVLQHEDADSTQQWSGQWNLNEIELPSGGVINVDYESDDYAYVQNKRSADMMEVVGFAESSTGDITHKLYETAGLLERTMNDFVAVAIPKPVKSAAEARKLYLDGIEQVHFNMLVKLKKEEDDTAERVSGYFDLDSGELGLKRSSDISGLTLSTTNLLEDDESDILLIPSRNLEDNLERDVPAITFAALQVMKFQRPGLLYPGYKNLGGGVDGELVKIAKGIFGYFSELLNVFKGFERHSMSRERGKNVDVANKASWVRLCNPNYAKLGGGSRVKSVTISDQWSQGAEGASTYGQTYDYTKKMSINGIESDISSGVAIYEPAMGGEENLMKNPLAYEKKKALAPKQLFYSESPIGESLFPSPSVGYSQVTVSDYANQNSPIDRTRSGKTIHGFYTAKDFPTVVRTTDVQDAEYKTNLGISLLNNSRQRGRAVSQGVVVELNDMHGKPLRQSVFDKNDVPLTSTEYQYLEDVENGVRVLNSEVDVIKTDGSIDDQVKEELGVCVDVWQEMLQEKTEMSSPEIEVGVDGLPLIFPVPIPTGWPALSYEKNLFQAAITTKLVKRKGILNKVIVTENGSTIETENVAYDRETGNVLLTRTQNEFDDDMYSFNYPAHWVYENMGQAYDNLGAIFENVDLDDDAFLPTDYEIELNLGDHVLIKEFNVNENTGAKEYYKNTEAYVATNEYLNNRYVLLSIEGEEYYRYENLVDIKVIRSAKKNMAATSIGQVTSRTSPIQGSMVSFNENSKVINASAMTYADEWQIECESAISEPITKTVVNYPSYSSLEPNASYNIKFWVLDGQTITVNEQVSNRTEIANILNNIDGTDLWESNNITLCTNDAPSLFERYGVIGLTNLSTGNDINILPSPKSKQFPGFEELNATNFNPYTSGYFNQFRPESSYVYYEDRTPGELTSRSAGMRIEDEGYINMFTPYWDRISSDWEENPTNDDNWTFTNKVTKYDIKGNEIENVNAIGVYSAARFDYKDALASAVANNAGSNDIFFESFEDEDFENNCANTPVDIELDLYDSDNDEISELSPIAHTGKNALKINASSVIYPVLDMNLCRDDIGVIGAPLQGEVESKNNSKYISDETADIPFVSECDDCLIGFSPSLNKKYNLSTWVATDNSISNGLAPEDIELKIDFGTTSDGDVGVLSFQPNGPVIEGWQRVDASFRIPSRISKLNLIITAPTSGMYLDDFRIHPFRSNMNTYVYDPFSLRLMATLDENNYASFYEYDDEGILIRVKRETEKGIATVQEGRTVLKPNNLDD